jgi:hypothetical protein
VLRPDGLLAFGLRNMATTPRLSTPVRLRCLEDTELAADLFLTLVLEGSGRIADYGIAIDPDVQERRRQGAVELFLNGVRTR